MRERENERERERERDRQTDRGRERETEKKGGKEGRERKIVEANEIYHGSLIFLILILCLQNIC